jgi:basic amino acid/polyamine antiporter, APA family
LENREELKREIGGWGSFAIGYADVGADIYIALGLIAAYAATASPVALGIAGITYICTGLCYAELSTAYPVAGGGQYYSQKAFGALHGFVAGWGLMLDYTIDIALFALATVGYIGFVLHVIEGNSILFVAPYFGLTAVVLIIFLVLLNLIGISYSSKFNEVIVAVNLVTVAVFAIFGLPYIIGSGLIVSWFDQVSRSFMTGVFGKPELGWQSFAYAITLAMASYIGIESISQAAEETRFPEKVIPQASKRAIVSVLLIAILFSLFSVTIVPWQVSANNPQYPMVTIAQSLPVVGPYLYLLVAATGALICYVSTNTGVIGVSRVTFSMGRLGLMPRRFARISSRFRTPYVTIILFSTIACALLLAYSALPGIDLLNLVASLYNFGALIAYMYVNASALALRFKDPGRAKWKMPLNFGVKKKRNGQSYEISVIPIVGFVSSLIVWVIIVGTHPLGRLIGALWFLAGIIGFLIYRWNSKHGASAGEAKR